MAMFPDMVPLALAKTADHHRGGGSLFDFFNAILLETGDNDASALFFPRFLHQIFFSQRPRKEAVR